VADLAVRVERQDGRAVLQISGELDLATVAVLQDAVADELRAGQPGEIVLDLSGLTFLDSSGLGALLQIRSDTMAAGGALTMAAVAPGAARVIEIAGLSATFGLSDS
jgi:anti-anti-sigma factor